MQQAIPVYSCLICGEAIEAGQLDPCALHVVGNIDRPRHQQKEQTFFCHMTCLQSRAAIHPGNFYMAEPDVPASGDDG